MVGWMGGKQAASQRIINRQHLLRPSPVPQADHRAAQEGHAREAASHGAGRARLAVRAVHAGVERRLVEGLPPLLCRLGCRWGGREAEGAWLSSPMQEDYPNRARNRDELELDSRAMVLYLACSSSMSISK